MESLPELKCKSCGAPLPYMTGENVLTCNYCGAATMIAGMDNIVRVEEHFIIPNCLDPGAVENICREWMGQGVFRARDLPARAAFKSIAGVFLPFWVVNVTAATYWSGMHKKTRTVGSGNDRRTEEYWVPDNGSFKDDLAWVVYARTRRDEYFGIEALNPGGDAVTADWGEYPFGFGLGGEASEGVDLAAGKQPFSMEAARGLKIINGQITRERAEEHSRVQIIDLQHTKAGRKVDTLTNCDTTFFIHGTDLVYAPMWMVEYSYGNRPYHLLVEGLRGRVIAGQAPVGRWDKVFISALLAGFIAAACGLGAYYLDVPWLYIGAGAAGLAAATHALVTALKKN